VRRVIVTEDENTVVGAISLGDRAARTRGSDACGEPLQKLSPATVETRVGVLTVDAFTICGKNLQNGGCRDHTAGDATEEGRVMPQPDEMVGAVRAALERIPQLSGQGSRIGLEVRDGVVVMSGQVQDIIAKRLAHRAAIEALSVDRVLDTLHVTPAEPRSDAQIAGFLDRLLMQESAFRDYHVEVAAPAPPSPAQTRGSPREHSVTASVRDGVVTLTGTVESLTHRRLADVLAWWAPGTCGVRNLIHVVPDEQDGDAEVSDALRIVLDKDPWLDAAAIVINVKERTVTLEGVVSSHEQRHMAEQDAWYILGVHGVVNRLRVQTR
jgi:osmotically-inducible protein OsmY